MGKVLRFRKGLPNSEHVAQAAQDLAPLNTGQLRVLSGLSNRELVSQIKHGTGHMALGQAVLARLGRCTGSAIKAALNELLKKRERHAS